MSEYLVVRCEIAAHREDELPEALVSLPLLGCEIRSLTDACVEARVYLEVGRHDACAAVEAALMAFGAEAIERAGVHEEDWLAAYRSTTRPFSVGNLWWLDPHPDSPTPAPENRLRLVVEPRMAFGTGSHESTRLILLDLEELRVSGASVLDVGTGSGILSLAALALDAAWVVGLDIDPVAIWVARQIAGQQERVTMPAFVIGSVAVLGRARFELVLCNMIVDHFMPVLPALVDLLDNDGVIVLSGILEDQSRSVRSDLEAVGLEVVGERFLDEWVSLQAVRR